ncbi:membrane protein [Perkinsela sp. CCAP 1560/4]|nr:membrane protein [Perkinsela sp. CCAP 1560/4]|eukprot:KNH03898.1 membrane protein [Perkinsela sp. CCAP 1560/4]
MENVKLRTKKLIHGRTPSDVPFLPLIPNPARGDTSLETLESIVPTPAPYCWTDALIPCVTEVVDTRNHAKEKERLLIRVAQLYQLYGSPAHHTEERTRSAAEGLGMELDIKSFPGFLIATFAAQDTSQTVLQTTVQGYHLTKLEQIDIFAQSCAAGECTERTFDQCVAELDAIMMSPDPWALPMLLLMYGISHGLSALCLFDGGWSDAFLAACLGVCTGVSALALDNMVSPKLAKLNGFFSCLLNSFLVRIVQQHLCPSICFFPCVVSSVLGVLPGLGITLAAIEISQTQIVAGAARLVYALFETLLIAIGISMGSQIAFWVGQTNASEGVSASPYTLGRWQSVVTFPMMLFSISVISNSSVDQFASQIITGLCGLFVYTVCAVLRCSTEMTVTLSSMVVALVGHMFTMSNGRPSVIPTLAGISLLVPSGLSVSAAVGSMEGGEAFDKTGSIVVSVLTVAASLSLGVFLASVMVNPGRQPRLERLG